MAGMAVVVTEAVDLAPLILAEDRCLRRVDSQVSQVQAYRIGGPPTLERQVNAEWEVQVAETLAEPEPLAIDIRRRAEISSVVS